MSRIEPVHSPCYCINFRHAAGVLSKYYDDALAPVHLTANQFFLLVSINQLVGCNKTELAQYTRLDRTTIIRNLETLKRKGFAEEVPGATRRNNNVQLTELGREVREKGADIWKRVQRETRAVLGEEDLDALWRLMANIDRLGAPQTAKGQG